MLGSAQNRVTKVCPIIIRHTEVEKEILIFRHPLASVQLIKGTVELGEPIEVAALRELREASGVIAKVSANLGVWQSAYHKQLWHFVVCDAENLPNTWTHDTQDDGGHTFTFYWHSFLNNSYRDWHPVYIRVPEEIKRRL